MIPKMPIARDVRVDKTEPKGTETAKAEKADNKVNLVTVMGFGKDDVIFKSDDVGCVQWRDSNGEIVALLARLKPDIWGFSRRGDADWSDVLSQYGNPDK